MAGYELATAYVTLAVESSEIAGAIGRGFAGGDKIAAKAGKSMAKAITKAYDSEKGPDLEKLAADAEKADKRVAASAEQTARKRGDAARAVEIAEQKLLETREKSIARDKDVLNAEKQLAAARKQGSADEVAAAEDRLARARDAATPTSADMAAEDRLAKAKRSYIDVSRDGVETLSRFKKEQGQANDKLNEAKRAADGAENATDKAAGAFGRLGGRVRDALRGDFKDAFRRVERDGESAAEQIERDFKRSGSDSARGFGSNFKAGFAGALGGLTSYFGLSEALDLGKFAITGAADLEQSIGGVETVFKDSGKQMLAWSNDADQTLGLTANEYNEFAARLGASLKNAGTPMDQLGEKTNGLITMGADLASLYGGTTAEAVDALGAALRGEMDPIERYGISLNDAALTAEGLKLGITKTKGAFSTQEKQLISMSLLQKQSADATGNFAREQNTASNVAQRLTAKLKETATEVGSRVTPFLTNLGSWFLDKGIPALEDFGKGVEGVWSILSVGDFKGAENTFGIDEDSPAIGVLFSIRDAGIELYEKALKPLGAFVADHLVPILATVGAAFAGWKIATVVTAISSAISMGGGLVAVLSTVVAAIGWVPLAIGAAVAALTWFFTATETGQGIVAAAWGVIQNAISGVVSWFQDTAMPALAAGWDVLRTVALAVWDGVLKPVFTAIGSLAQQIFTGVVLPALQQFGGYITGTVWPMIQKLWTDYIQPVFTLIGGLAIWLWNNAIKPAVTAITYYWQNILGPVIVWLWQSVISPAFTAIGAVISFAVNNVIFPVLDLLKAFLVNVIAPAMVWLWNNVFVPAWNGISAAISATVGWIVGTAVPWLQSAWDVIAKAATWLWQNILKPVWDGIRIAIAIAVTAITVYIDLLKWYFNNVIAPVAMWLWNNVMKPVWSGIQTAIGAVVSWFRDTAWPVISKVIDWLRTKFDQFKLGLSIIWTAIRVNVIAPVVNWFRNTAWPIVSRIIDSLKTAFTALKDRLAAIWSAIKDNVIAPVVNWLLDKVKPKIDQVTDKMKSAFTTLKDGVLTAWDAIKSGMKKPINGVIEIYNKHIAGNFNKAIETIFGKDGGSKYKLSEMTPFASGGYTGPGSKYQPAGVVHADEYVIRKESQNSLRREAPGFLDSLNRHGAKALGYAGGGLVQLRSPFGTSAPRGEGFGARGGKHKGIDFPMPAGTILKAVAAGVASRTTNAAAGNKLELSIGNGLVAGYHHLSSYIAQNGQSVGRGADVGRVGSTGRSSGPHLHFSLKKDGHYVDPAPYLGAGGAAGSGGGDSSWWNPFTGLWDTIKDGVSTAVGGGAVGPMLSKIVENSVGNIGTWIDDKLSAVGDAVVGTAEDVGGATRWSAVATEALIREGQYGPNRFKALIARMKKESSFNQYAINKTDSNARRGTPSKGLMQVIQPTFDAYRDKSLSSDIYDPLANIVASIRYTLARYGDLEKGWNRKGGYAAGGYTGAGTPGTPAGIVHADEFVLRSAAQRSISKAAPGFLDRLNRMGAGAIGYADGGLVGYASGGTVSPTAKIGSSKVTVLLEGLTGTEKQVTSAAGKLADGIVKVFNDRMKSAKTTTVNKLTDSLSSLRKEQTALKKAVSSKTSDAKKSAVNQLSNSLDSLKKQRKALDPKKQASQYATLTKKIESTSDALKKARQGDYSGAASGAAKRLADVQKQIADTEAALKQARRGDFSKSAAAAGAAAYSKYAESTVSKLTSLAKTSETLAKKIKDAKAALVDATKIRDDYAESMTEKFAGTFGLTDAAGTTGVETLVRRFQDAATGTKTFTAQLAALRGKGLSEGLIDQIAQLGVVSGGKVASNLLNNGTDSQIQQMSKAFASLNTVAASSGTSLAEQMYQAGVNTAKGLVTGLTSQKEAVDKAAEALAASMLTTVRKELGIKSPSRAMAKLGRFTGLGMVKGVKSMIPAVQASMEALVAVPDGSRLDGFSTTIGPRPSGVLPSASWSAMSSPADGAVSGQRIIQVGDVHGYTVEEVAAEFDKKLRRREALYTR